MSIVNQQLEQAIERILRAAPATSSEMQDAARIARALSRWWGDAALTVARHVVTFLEQGK